MAQSDLHSLSYNLSELELAGRWVAVDPQGGSGLRNLPSGGVVVDYDSELDLLCQRVAAAGRKRLTIFKYEDRSDPAEGYRGPRHTA